MSRLAAITLVIAGILFAQDAPRTSPALLINSGKPLRVLFECTEEEVRTSGLACNSDEPCPLYLELSGVETAGNRIFLAGNIHTSTVTFASILLASEDGGHQWTEPYDRIRSAGFDQIQFIDFEHGWVGGQLLLTMPRDPFFLITGDGGKTWRRRPVFAESRPGAIQQFYFESANTGALIIDRTQTGDSGGRYERFESQTGGESWMPREVSAKPLELKNARPANAAWRLRADRATKSYQVEKRETSAWRSVASFVVEIGECRIKEPEAAPPPPELEAQPATPPPPPTAAPRKPPSLRKKP